MKTLPHELAVPPGVEGDRDAFEIARIWAAHGKQVVRMNINSEIDPAGWGLMLVDLARHIARAYEQSGNCPADAALQRVLEGVNLELANPTDMGSGSLESATLQ